MSATVEVLIVFGMLLILLFSGLQLPFCLGFVSVACGLMFWGSNAVLAMFVSSANSLTQSTTYVAAPLFLFMGAILERSGIADKMFDAMYVVFGRVRGGLCITVIVICTLLAAATGIIGAAIGLMTMLALPAMDKYKYDFKFSTGAIMGAGCLGQLIPPSVVMIVYASQAQLSIGRLFAGGIGAGIMISAIFIIYVVIRCAIDPTLAPAIAPEELSKYSTAQRVGMLFKSVLPTVFLILVVLGSIMAGIATPTEGAAVGCFGALLLAILNKRFSIKMIIESCYVTAKSTAMVFFIVLGAQMFCSMFLGIGGGKVIANMLTVLGGGSRWGVMLVMFFIVFVMGMFMDSYGIVMIGVPLFCPVAAQLGFDPIWFGTMFTVMMLVSYMSPPFAYAAFYVKGSYANPDNMDLGALYKATFPYLGLYILAIVLLCLFPQIITWLPSLMYG